MKLLVEAWDGAPFYQVLVARAETERAALEAARQHLADKGALLVSHDPGETTWVELASLSASWTVDPPSPHGILFESGRIWHEAHFAGVRRSSVRG